MEEYLTKYNYQILKRNLPKAIIAGGSGKRMLIWDNKNGKKT